MTTNGVFKLLDVINWLGINNVRFLLRWPMTTDELRHFECWCDAETPLSDILLEVYKKWESIDVPVGELQMEEDPFDPTRRVVFYVFRGNRILIEDVFEFKELVDFLADDNNKEFCDEINDGLGNYLTRLMEFYFIPTRRLFCDLLCWPKRYFDMVYLSNTIEWSELKRVRKIECLDTLIEKYDIVSLQHNPLKGIDIYYKNESDSAFQIKTVYNIEMLEDFVNTLKDQDQPKNQEQTEEQESGKDQEQPETKEDRPRLIHLLSSIADSDQFIKEHETSDFFNFSRLVEGLVNQLEAMGVGADVIYTLLGIPPGKLLSYTLGDIRALSKKSVRKLFSLYSYFHNLYHILPKFRCICDKRYEQVLFYDEDMKVIYSSNDLTKF